MGNSTVKEHLVAIKLGGSMLTDKTKVSKVINKSALQFIASELAEVHAKEDANFLLGTGAGTYGHYLAHSYTLTKGIGTDKQLYGMCVTHNEIRRLSLRVAQALTTKSLPAFTVSPASLMTCSDGAIQSTHIAPLRVLLGNSCIPIVHGDTIPDAVHGTTIFSTEKVFNTCLKELRSDYKRVTVIYIMDKEGILDANGHVIPKLTATEKIVINGQSAHDVTGGVESKIRSAHLALQYADAVYIIGSSKHGQIQKAVHGQQVGTQIIADTN